MRHTYSLQLIARVLLVCIFLQNCSGFNNISLNNIEGHNKELSVQAILGEEFVAEGGHLVTFYKQEEELMASVQVNPLDEKDKFYNDIPVLIEKGVNLESLPQLGKAIQQKRIHVKFSQQGKPTKIAIHKPWLHGGGDPKEIIVFCGNPGVGKSTLCNSIFQKDVFESGISLEEGLTTKEQEYLYDNKLYIDTPGLADLKMKERAAEEVEKALKHNNNYKIVFVATLESGRIKPADLVTINTICDAIKTDFQYGIIFNKITDPVYKAAKEKGLNRYLVTLNKKPHAAVLLKREDAIEDRSGEYFEINSKNRIRLLNFLNALAANKIEEKDVEKIDVRDFQEKVDEMAEKYKKELAELNKRIAEQAREMSTMSVSQAKEVSELSKKIAEQSAQINAMNTPQPQENNFVKALGIFAYLAGHFLAGAGQGHREY